MHKCLQTFEEWADFPDGQWREGGELAIGHLHEEQRDTAQYQKQAVWNKERSCKTANVI